MVGVAKRFKVVLGVFVRLHLGLYMVNFRLLWGSSRDSMEPFHPHFTHLKPSRRSTLTRTWSGIFRSCAYACRSSLRT